MIDFTPQMSGGASREEHVVKFAEMQDRWRKKDRKKETNKSLLGTFILRTSQSISSSPLGKATFACSDEARLLFLHYLSLKESNLTV